MIVEPIGYEDVEDQDIVQITPLTDDSVTLLTYDNGSRDLDLYTQTVSNILTDNIELKGGLITAKRHRLLDIVCNNLEQIRILIGHELRYVLKHNFM